MINWESKDELPLFYLGQKIIGFFPWLDGKNSLILWWQFLHPLDVSKSLETPINKGFWSSSKNYEFDKGFTNSVPNLLPSLSVILKKTKSGCLCQRIRVNFLGTSGRGWGCRSRVPWCGASLGHAGGSRR